MTKVEQMDSEEVRAILQGELNKAQDGYMAAFERAKTSTEDPAYTKAINLSSTQATVASTIYGIAKKLGIPLDSGEDGVL